MVKEMEKLKNISKGRTSMSQYIGCGILSVDEWPEPDADESIADEDFGEVQTSYSADTAQVAVRGKNNIFSRHNFP